MDTSNARRKLEEAQFFLDHLADNESRWFEHQPLAFRFYLSAFLNAAYGVTERLQIEVWSDLGKGMSTQEFEKIFSKWLHEWRGNRLTGDEPSIWDFMRRQRVAEVHGAGAKAVEKKQPVRVRPERPTHPAYMSHYISGSPVLLGGEGNEGKGLDWLPPWAIEWREALVHNFTLRGQRLDALPTCEHYLTLLRRLVEDAQPVTWSTLLPP